MATRLQYPKSNHARKPKLLDQLGEALRARHYSRRTEETRNESLVRHGKGGKDRVTMLPESLKASLQDHLKRGKAIHERDIAEGWGRVLMPGALDRKYPNASKEWRWQWVFPQETRWKNIGTGEEGRHRVHQSLVQKAVRDAVLKAGLTDDHKSEAKTCHY